MVDTIVSKLMILIFNLIKSNEKTGKKRASTQIIRLICNKYFFFSFKQKI